MLKLVIAKLEEVAEGLRDLYKMGGDGKYHLETEEDADAKARLAEFRENNIKLMKERDELEGKLKGLGDPKEIEAMRKKIQAIDDKQLLAAGEIDKLVEQKTERMKADYENRIQALEKVIEQNKTDLAKTTDHLSSVLIDSEITRAVTATGIPRKGALQDLLARGKRVFKLVEGKPTPMEGDKVLYGKDAKAPLTFDEWAAIQLELSPYLFEASAGGGSAGGAGGKKIGESEKEALAKLPPQERLKQIHGAAAK